MAGPQKLDGAAIRERLVAVDGWTLVDGKLRRAFQFDSFVAAFGFMASAALESEKMGHHPEWFNVYNRVVVDLATHDVDGISDYDFELAAKMNAIAGA
jgi:4a-hydroxytetrahydrobiopterin dehydratase